MKSTQGTRIGEDTVSLNPAVSILMVFQDGTKLAWVFQQPVAQSKLFAALGKTFGELGIEYPDLELPGVQKPTKTPLDMMYVYIRSERNLWTVGYYHPGGAWCSESDHDSPEKAAERVHWLNGGNGLP